MSLGLQHSETSELHKQQRRVKCSDLEVQGIPNLVANSPLFLASECSRLATGMAKHLNAPVHVVRRGHRSVEVDLRTTIQYMLFCVRDLRGDSHRAKFMAIC